MKTIHPSRATTAPSVITSASTTAELEGLVAAVAGSERQPLELLVSWDADSAPPEIADLPFPLRVQAVGAPALARQAQGEKLMFLPADARPDPATIAAYEHHLDQIDAVVRDTRDGLGVRRRTLLQRLDWDRTEGIEAAARAAAVPVRRLHIHGRRSS